MKLGIVIAMESEAQPLLNALKAKAQGTVNGTEFYSGKYRNVEYTVAVSGEGKVNAAVSAGAVASVIKPDVMMNFGIAGGTGHIVKGGKAVVGDVWEHDFDLTAAGYKPGKFRGRTDDALSEALCAAIGGERGTVATGDVFVADPKRVEYISKTFRAVVCEMECAAVFAVAKAYDIPFAAVKYISDYADSSAKESMDENVPTLSEGIAKDIIRAMDLLSEGTWSKR